VPASIDTAPNYTVRLGEAAGGLDRAASSVRLIAVTAFPVG
jgi:hypothetical protein